MFRIYILASAIMAYVCGAAIEGTTGENHNITHIPIPSKSLKPEFKNEGNGTEVLPTNATNELQFTFTPMNSSENSTVLKGNVFDYGILTVNSKKGKFYVINNYYRKIVVETVSHVPGNDYSDSATYTVNEVVIPARESSPVYSFFYQQGLFASFDYWYIRVRVDNVVYKTKSNFFCNIAREDFGATIQLIVDISNRKFTVKPPVSSSCDVALE